MENTYGDLEESIEKTDGRLESIASNLTKCDGITGAMSCDNEAEIIEGLLQTVKQVQTDYATFRGDLLELRELQRQVRYELQTSAHELQKTVLSLRLRLPNGQLPKSSIENVHL